MTFAHSVRETCLNGAPNLSGTGPTGNGDGAVRRSSLTLAGGSTTCRSTGSFPLICTSFVHEKTIARTFARIREMYTAEQTLDHVRPRLMGLIEHYKKATGCTAQAVKRVASKIGASPHWVRRVVGRRSEATVHAHHFLNILREHVATMKAKRQTAKAARILSRENPSQAELSA